jgi:2-polyprenyl-6-methoxyphenol hydroxylase-like FAD-dependent oxidoreductase
MKKLTENWSEPFRSLVQKLPDDVEVRSIRIEDWMFSLGRAHAHPRAVLVGDSAHTMTMCKLIKSRARNMTTHRDSNLN